ncbi:redoxin domain-containing protein [Puteibacter caeruleilacunae]|nr:redoxin domain-containing protein [Puteibacter caeruleilacunae]
MKQIITLILLLTVFSGNCKEILKYNLNVGDEFYYKVTETKLNGSYPSTHIYWLKFKVLWDFTKDYQLSVEFYRIKRSDVTGSITDTKLEYFNQDKLAKTDQLITGIPFKFIMKRNGKIEPISLSDEQSNKILNKSNFKSFEDLVLAHSSIYFKPKELAQFIQQIFIKFLEFESNPWKYPTLIDDVFPAWEHYSIDKHSKDPISISALANYQYSKADSTLIPTAFGAQVTPKFANRKANYLLHPDTRLTIRINVQDTSQILFVADRNKPQNSQLANASRKLIIEKIDTLKATSNVYVTNSNIDMQHLNAVKISFPSDFFDKDLLPSHKHSNGAQYTITTVEIDKPAEILYSYTDKNQVKQSCNIMLEPYDNIRISSIPNGNLVFSGPGAFKNNLNRELQDLPLLIRTNTPIDQVIKKFKESNHAKWKLIDSSKDSLSIWAYKHLQTNALYANLNHLMEYYKKNQNPYKPFDETLFVKLFKEAIADINNFDSSSSIDFRDFISQYTKEKIKGLYERTLNKKNLSELAYMHAKYAFLGESRYYTMAYFVSEALKTNDPKSYNNIYTDFVEEYPQTSYTSLLQKQYNKQHKLNIGSTAPNFSINDAAGQHTSLDEFRGKWVFLVHCNLDIEEHQEVLFGYSKLSEKLDREDFQLIVSCADPHVVVNSFINSHHINAIMFHDLNFHQTDQKYFEASNSVQNYLINPEGKIEAINISSPIISFEDYIIEFLKAKIDRQESGTSIMDILYFILGFAVSLGLTLFINRLRLKQLRKKEEERRERLELEMQAVRSQLNPHFLFNSMNSIQHLVNADENEKANIFLSKFGSLMRKVLNQSEEELIPLADELETISTYLELEALRHRFTYTINLEEGIDQYNIEIPPMLLQPFVENAVVHGINGMNTNGKIAVEVSRLNGDHIRIQIIDNGKGLHQKCSSKQSNGKGLHITQRRVDLMMEKFKHDISIDLKDAKEIDPNEAGTVAEIIFELEKQTL